MFDGFKPSIVAALCDTLGEEQPDEEDGLTGA